MGRGSGCGRLLAWEKIRVKIDDDLWVASGYGDVLFVCDRGLVFEPL